MDETREPVNQWTSEWVTICPCHVPCPTFLQLHGEELQLLHPLLQLVLGRRGHGVHLLVAPVVVLVGVGVEHLCTAAQQRLPWRNGHGTRYTESQWTQNNNNVRSSVGAAMDVVCLLMLSTHLSIRQRVESHGHSMAPHGVWLHAATCSSS